MKEFKIQLSIVPMDANNHEDKRPRLYALIEDLSVEPHSQRAIQGLPMDGGKHDVHAAQNFFKIIGDVLLERFEPLLAMPYTKNADNLAIIDIGTVESRRLEWAEKFKMHQHQSTES